MDIQNLIFQYQQKMFTTGYGILLLPHYIELVKSRAYKKDENVREERKSAQYTLHQILKTILKLLAPILHFITEYIYQELYQPSRSIHLESFPDSENNIGKEDHRTLELINLNSNIWKIKKDQGLSLKDGLKKLYIPNTLGEFISDLKQMHNIDTIIISKPDENENLA
jgi:valyl-tRNA synthetase